MWEAVDLLEQLLLDMGSHLSASVAGWSFPMSRSEMYDAALLATVINITKGKGDKRFLPDWPWSDKPKAEDVTPEERTVLRAQLQSKSAFGQKRTEGPANV